MAEDFKFIQIEPWTKPLAELEVRPQGEHTRSLVLARVPKELEGKKVTISVAFDLDPLTPVCKPVEVTLD